MGKQKDPMFREVSGKTAGYVQGNTLGGTAIRGYNPSPNQPNTLGQQNSKIRTQILGIMRKSLTAFYTMMYAEAKMIYVKPKVRNSEWNWFYKQNNKPANFTVDSAGLVEHFNANALFLYNKNSPTGTFSYTESGSNLNCTITGLTPSTAYGWVLAAQAGDYSFLETKYTTLASTNSSGVLTFTVPAAAYTAANPTDLYACVISQATGVPNSYQTAY